ncbi:MAG TPA: TA system VapC family ribonuclease toxin [Marmoricola sp.]
MPPSKRIEPIRLLDVNALLAITRRGHLHHEAAHAWLDTLPVGSTWATCPITEASFLRLSMNPAVSGTALTGIDALALLEDLRQIAGHRFIADPTSLAVSRLDRRRLVGHKQVTDFHIVNLVASSNAVLATFDRRIREALAPEDRDYVEIIPV